jgi:hypothetical protein
MNQNTQRILFTLTALTLVLSACAPAATQVPTQDPAALQEQINQAVEATMAAQNQQATEQQALIIPSNTPLPTQTEAVPPTLEVPTATPFVIVPPTNTVVSSGGGGGGGGGVTVKPELACNVINQQPLDNSVWKKNKEFDINWTLVNTGTKTWPAGWDLKYYSGPQMTNVTFVELPQVKPGESYKVILDAAAPNQVGFQVMTWSLEGGNFCFPYIAIIVE